jgi:regulator of RNase E activity RraA
MTLAPDLIEELRQFSSPSVLNGIKHLGTNPDLLTMDRTIGCMLPSLGAVIGYAATARVSTRPEDDPGLEASMVLRADLFRQIDALPLPRVLVVENTGNPPGPTSYWGEVQANLHLALGCCAGITNGPVRDLHEMEALGFQCFAGGVTVGGEYIRHVAAGGPVTVGGLVVEPGDLLHGDLHGVLKIPRELAPDLPEAIRAVESREREMIAFYRSPSFSVDALLDQRDRSDKH